MDTKVKGDGRRCRKASKMEQSEKVTAVVVRHLQGQERSCIIQILKKIKQLLKTAKLQFLIFNFLNVSQFLLYY